MILEEITKGIRYCHFCVFLKTHSHLLQTIVATSLLKKHSSCRHNRWLLQTVRDLFSRAKSKLCSGSYSFHHRSWKRSLIGEIWVHFQWTHQLLESNLPTYADECEIQTSLPVISGEERMGLIGGVIEFELDRLYISGCRNKSLV